MAASAPNSGSDKALRGNAGRIGSEHPAATPDRPVGTLGHALRAARMAQRRTLEDVAGRAGCAKSYLSMLESGRRGAPANEELLARLADTLGLARDALLGLARWQHTPAPIRRRVQTLESTQRLAAEEIRTLARGGAGRPSREGGGLDEAWRSGRLQRLVARLDPAGGGHGGAASGEGGGSANLRPAAMLAEIPLINSVAAGYPRDFTDLGYPARIADTYVRSPDVNDPDAFACRVIGDSMMPEYREGDIVIFSPMRMPKDGMDCFVRLEPDHESTFKRVYFEREGSGDADAEATHIRLEPLNTSYPARVVSREQVAGLYPAVSVTRRLV